MHIILLCLCCAVSVPVQEPVPAVCVWGHVRCGAQCGMRSPYSAVQCSTVLYSAVQCCTVQYRGASCGGQQCAAAIGWVGTGTCGDWRHWRPGESGAAGWRQQQTVCSPLATPDQRGVLTPGIFIFIIQTTVSTSRETECWSEESE